MKRYIHDYTDPAKAEQLLYKALRYFSEDDFISAREYAEMAREKLQEYLAKDNEILEDTSC